MTSEPTSESWKFLGRDTELRFIADSVTAAEPRSVVVAGPAGVGKTRLAREALAAAHRSGRPTRWAAGTSSAAAIPLGAVAHLLPAIETGAGPLSVLQRAGAAIADGGRGHRPVVGIDDAHLLDELSMTLVHQLAMTRTASLVLTVRTGTRAPDPVVRLWKDGLAERLELQQLGRGEVDRLVTLVLGGIVDSRTRERLWRASKGNALFLRELVVGGRQTGRLRIRSGVWRWEGPMRPTPRLQEIVHAQLDGLDRDEWAALELLAVGEPIGLPRLAGLVNPEVVAGLERRGLVTVTNSGWRAQASLAHPVHGAVVRDQLPEADACRLRRRLADGHLCRQGDLLRAGRLLVDSDEPQAHAGLLADAAVRANVALEHGLAARMANAGIDGGVGVRAHLALVEAARWSGCAEHAEQVAKTAAPLATSTEDTTWLGIERSLNLFFGLGEAAAAETLLDKVTADAAGTGTGSTAGAIRGLLAFFTGRPEQAAECAAESAGEGAGSPDGAAQLWRSCAATVGLAARGRVSEALAAAARGWVALDRCVTEPETALARLVLAHGELSALLVSGRFRQAEARAAELHSWSMAQPEWAGDAVAAAHVGWVALAGGRPRTAVRWLAEAAAGLGQRDPGGGLPVCLALLAQAHAVLGDAAAARRDLEGSSGAHHAGVFEPEILLAETWLAAAENRVRHATDRALRAAAVAAEMGHLGMQAQALHTAVRVGCRAEGVSDALRELAGVLEGPLVAVYSAHAQAAASGAGDRLDEVAAEFEAMGAALLATEAAAHAASAHERAGGRRQAAASSARAASLARVCEMVRTPAFEQLTPPSLTSREDEVAGLVVQGLNNQAIAERLVLSVRTVEAHLAHAYAKLGISSRGELAAALGTDRAPSASSRAG